MSLLFKMSPKYSAEVLFSVPKHKKAMMCLTEKIQVLDKLHPDMSYCTVDHKFSKSAIFII